MKQLCVEKVYIDKISGKSADRPQRREMLSFVRNGDTVMVEAISRFARNTKDLLELIDILQKKGVEFVSQKEKKVKLDYVTFNHKARWTAMLFIIMKMWTTERLII